MNLQKSMSGVARSTQAPGLATLLASLAKEPYAVITGNVGPGGQEDWLEQRRLGF